MSKIKLSILVPTVPRRIDNFFPKLINELLRQCVDRNDVEVLGLFDNKKRSIGAKRQSMLDITSGEYVVFIDDDDRVAEDYISEILNALQNNPDADCVVFDSIYTSNTGDKLYCKYGIEFEYNRVGDKWTGKPAHTMVYKTELAKKHKYADKLWEEDKDWVIRACKDIKNQVRIDKVLYYYDFNTNTSEFVK